jgi:hypothetical protein
MVLHMENAEGLNLAWMEALVATNRATDALE